MFCYTLDEHEKNLILSMVDTSCKSIHQVANSSKANMVSKLQEIIQIKSGSISALESQAGALRKTALARNEFRSMENALRSADLTLIAEVKKASPSVGVIYADYQPSAQAKLYESSGAHAISVLTEEKFFLGHLDHLRIVREVCNLPVLRKDFIIHRHQLYESCVAGADAVLLIATALKEDTLRDLHNEARDLQLDVLVETHNLREIDLALDIGASIVGINNRNLATFDVNLETTIQLAEELPDDVVLVSESGIKTREDVLRLRSVGVNAILVGESLMRSKDTKTLIQELLRPPVL
jgi:indole-3-glycerol phosphate synthase